MLNSTLSTENGSRTEWGRKQLRSCKRTRKARKMGNLCKLMEVKENSKAKEIVGWLSPTNDWELWIQKLSSVHRSTWKKAGIYEAVMSSIYKIQRHNELILELISRWCSKTNTFVFPWGDATLTLEDMLVLGGFSATGLSSLSSVEDDTESIKIKDQLGLAMKEIKLSSYRKCSQFQWIKKFMGSGHELEHAAFLSLWLSRFIFSTGSPTNYVVYQNVFPLAAKLSKGIKIALGPAVLATLYKKLTAFTKIQSGTFDLRGQFHLVQIWAWERLPIVKCLFSSNDLPRIARWSEVMIPKGKELKSVMDYSEKSFLWRPYGEIDPESFAICMRACEIVGFDSEVERYQPQYVIRQFGFDRKMATIKSAKACKCKVEKITMSKVKVEDEVEYGPPPGFAPKARDLSFVDSVDDSNGEDTVMEVVDGLEHGRREDEVEGSSNVEGEAMEVVNGSGLQGEFDAENCMNERSMDLGLEMEARMRRLEDIFYERIREVEAANK